MTETPVAFLIFNRPELTRRVFESIRAARPRKLLVVADGPRNPAEAARCAAARAILDEVDWPCDVEKDFAEGNLGCRNRVASGLDWVFSRVEEAIILEDDCLPHADFFRFCGEMLNRYREDDRIVSVCGDHFLPGPVTPNSYYFSRYTHIWGWASWRRAWRHYDVNMSRWPQFRNDRLLPFSAEENAQWERVFDQVSAGRIDTWDYQLQFAALSQNQLVVMPEKNLVSNIGFGSEATHTRAADWRDSLPTEGLGPLRHPEIVAPQLAADAATYRCVFAQPKPPMWRVWGGRLKRRLTGRVK